MALLGLSLILASVIYVAIRRPPWVETLAAVWSGYPHIEQPPTTSAIPEPRQTSQNPEAEQHSAPPSSDKMPSAAADRAAMPPPPPIVTEPSDSSSANSSPQTTPKASATTSGASVPSFSLSASPSASAAAVARSQAKSQPSATPTLGSGTRAAPAASSSSSSSSGLMAPPPRPPPSLNPVPSSPSSLLAAPARSGPLPNRTYDRQPGTSTLAPPPTHSSKPAKPSRKVLLDPGHSPLDWARLANGPTSDLRNVAPGTPYLRVTPSMLKVQNGRKGRDAWTALGGKVYNIHPYIPFHPGGKPELLRCAGRDGTKLFGEIHPWVNYETMLSSCLIGLLVDESEAQSSGEMDAMD